MAKITIFPELGNKSRLPTAGIWVESSKGAIGLVADEQTGPYLCIYGPNYKNIGQASGNPLPAFAICLGDDGLPSFQLPLGNTGVKHISLMRLLKLLASTKEVA